MTAIASDMLSMPPRLPKKRKEQIFRGFFGAPISIIVMLWNLIAPTIDKPGAMEKHILWALVFLKVYSTTEVYCRIVGWVHPDTFHKWSWYFIEKIASLKDQLIVLDNRFEGFGGTTQCLLALDAFDCMVLEPWPFDTKWYSVKFNGPGVKYELGVCIKTGRIVWLNVPFPAGKQDSKICIETLLTLLADDEGVEVDGGYVGHDKFKAPLAASSRRDRKMKSVVRGRLENVNGRIKVFNVLTFPFRHLNPRTEMMNKHKMCTEAVVVVTELKFENGEGLYDVPYDISYNVTYD